MVDARNDGAVSALRRRKHREEKSSRGLARAFCAGERKGMKHVPGYTRKDSER